MSRENAVKLALLLTFAAQGVFLLWSLDSMWGLNHLRFAPTVFLYLYVVAVPVLAYMVLGRAEPFGERILAAIDRWLFSGGRLPQITVSLVAIVIFATFRSEGHFLGDGIGWLSIFGEGTEYYRLWAEAGSITFVRQLQQLLGGYNQRTAAVSFQVLSVISGGIVVYNLIAITRSLTQAAAARLLCLVTLLFSGSLLLFFGYVEFYPAAWAAVTTLIQLSLTCNETVRHKMGLAVVFMIACLMHMQAAVLFPALLYLLMSGSNPGFRKTFMVKRRLAIYTGILFGCSLVFVYLNLTRVEVETVFLPLLSGRHPASQDYITSSQHVLDVVNQILLVVPGALVLLALSTGAKAPCRGKTSIVLALMSIGSLLFLFTVDPVLGMARDWDLMSLMLLPPVLFLLHRINASRQRLAGRIIFGYALVCLMASASFVAVEILEVCSADRFHTLLKHYGAKNRGGWANYVGYLEMHGPKDESVAALREMDRLYPEFKRLRHVYTLLDRREYRRALDISAELVDGNPYQADFLQVFGNSHGKLGHDDSAEYYYEQAVKLKPHHVILNELGQLYLKRGKYKEALETFRRARGHATRESFVGEGLGLTYIYLKDFNAASALADSLFMDNPNSPGGHLLKLTICLNLGDQEAARSHYLSFLKYGQGRSDYDRMWEYYEYLR